MGQIFSWFLGSQQTPALQDVAVEEQSQPKQTTPTPTVPASTVKPAEYEVQVEVSRPAAKTSAPAPEVDPFDALAGSLPSSDPVAPKAPKYTGPEVKEPGLISEEAKRCGEKEHTLPPGYRKEDMEKKTPAGKPEKPKEAPKPITDDEALDSLSAGFTSSAAPSATKSQPAHAAPPAAKSSAPEKTVPAGKPDKPKEVSKPVAVDDAVESLSAGFVSSAVPSAAKTETKAANVTAAKTSNAPPPAQKRQEVTVPTSVSPAPPADKKAKVEKPAKDSAKAAPSSSLATKPKADEGEPMSLDALSALEDMLPAAKPAPEAPKLRPEDIVDEKKLKSEKGVRVGERDDTLPPEYRFSDEKHKERPAPPKQPSLDPADALDILSGDFTSSSVAPAVQAPVPPSAPAKQQPKVEDLSALDALAEDFVAPAQAKKVASDAPPAAKSTLGSTSDEGDPMSLDALSALGDTLPAAKPVPESPKLRPEDIIKEKPLTSEKGVRVGERDDTLPPDYRFPEDKTQKHPAPPKQPSLDPADALDLLSEGFSCSSAAPTVQSSLPPSAPPADDDPMSLDALSALEDTLPAAKPVPESPKLRPEDIINEKTITSEKGVRVGERDDTLPPNYRFSKEELKKHPAPAKEPSLDPADALDILSEGFTSSSAAPAVQAPVPPSAPPADSSADFALEELAGDFVKATPASQVHSASTAPPKAERQLSESTASAMDALSDTLKDIGPSVPEPAPVPPKDIVKEKQVVEEKIHKAGERDDTLPPDYRPTEADIKAAAQAKAKAAAQPKQPSMDESAALDALSSEFSTSPPVTVPAGALPQHPHAPPPAKSPAAPGPVLDKLASTLAPDFSETKTKDSKPKVKGGKSKSKPKKPAVVEPASVPHPEQPSKDVVSTSPAKKGGKS